MIDERKLFFGKNKQREEERGGERREGKMAEKTINDFFYFIFSPLFNQSPFPYFPILVEAAPFPRKPSSSINLIFRERERGGERKRKKKLNKNEIFIIFC